MNDTKENIELEEQEADVEEEDNVEEDEDEQTEEALNVDDADEEEDDPFDFETDDEGNIVVDDSDDSDEDYVDEEDSDNEEQDETDSEEDSDEAESSSAPEVVEPAPAPDAKDIELDRLRKEIAELRSQTKDTLAKLGIKDTDEISGLVKLAAEADELTPEEYLKRKADADSEAKKRMLEETAKFERMAKDDIAALHAEYPETRVYDDVRKLPDDIKMNFARFRDKGLSAVEAYAAANPRGIRSSVASAVKQQSLSATKNHIKSAVPKGAKDTSIHIPKGEMAGFKDMFPDASEKEILDLYRRAVKN